MWFLRVKALAKHRFLSDERRHESTMGKVLTFRLLNFLLLSVILPLFSGCNGGGGSAGSTSMVGSLFGASSSGGSTLASSSGPVGTDGGGAALASIHNPEPTTMLLVGGGVMAMAYLRKRKS